MDHFSDSEFLLANGYDDAIVGATEDDVLVYDKDMVIQILAREMPLDDAIEFFDYNIAGAYVGEKTPLFITTVKSINEGIVF